MKNPPLTPGAWLHNFALAALLLAASGPIAREASASPELDRQFALERIGFLRAWDNVDGLFGDYVAKSYRDYFAHQDRFVPQDVSKADPLLTQSKIPYNKLIEDREVLGQLSRTTKSDSLIRTKIFKEGRKYRFTIDWLHAPKIDLLASETFILDEPASGQTLATTALEDGLHKALDSLLARVPFRAMITGRDNNSVTVNIGQNAEIKRGDQLIVGSIDEVKKHPLLNSIVDWRISQTGRVEIETVDEGISFGKVVEEEKGRQVTRYQKVLKVVAARKRADAPEDELAEERAELEKPPQLGWIAGTLPIGTSGRGFSAQPGSLNNTGGGLVFGAKGSGEIWLNRQIFFNGDFDFLTGGYGQAPVTTPATAPSDGGAYSAFAWRLSAGYTYLATGDFFGPKGWLKVGYHSITHTLATSATLATLPIGYGSLFVGVGGYLPVRAGIGVELNFDFGVFNGAGATGFTITGASDAHLYLGVQYRYANRISFRVGLDVQANAMNFTTGTIDTTTFTSGTSSQNLITFSPSILYYF